MTRYVRQPGPIERMRAAVPMLPADPFGTHRLEQRAEDHTFLVARGVSPEAAAAQIGTTVKHLTDALAARAVDRTRPRKARTA